MSIKKKIAIIGCGNIASFHVPAIRAAGMEIEHCASSPNSKTIKYFATQHNINQIWSDPKKLANSYDQWDGIIITTSITATMDLLKIAIKSNKPVLVEKPIAISSIDLKQFSSSAPTNVIVAYNRRYYNTVQRARDFVLRKQKIRATMTLPENISSEFENPFLPHRINSVHGFDILNYIFDSVSIEHVMTSSNDDPFFGRQAILRSNAGHLINLNMNWNAPANFKLSLDDGQEQLDLCPFEKFQLYRGMKVIEPTKQYPIRQYLPNLVKSGNVFDDMQLNIKPGFLNQSTEFSNLISGKSVSIGANLTDAYNNQLIAEKLLLI